MTNNYEFLTWIYERLKNVHNENPNVDYMLRFKKLLEDAKMNETSEKVIVKGNVVKVKSGEDYFDGVSTLCKLTHTGNGYIAKFPSHSSCFQDQYVCLDYGQAEYLYLALSKVFKD